MSIAERLLRYGVHSKSQTVPAPRETSAAGSTPANPAFPGIHAGSGTDEWAPDADLRWSDPSDDSFTAEFAARLGGRKLMSQIGPAWLVERSIALDDGDGVPHLRGLARLDCDALALLTQRPDLARVAPNEIAFFDTETTGLAGGTGTSIFLAGIATLRDDRLHVRQFFLPDPGVEIGFLAALEQELARYRVVLTFNGGRFDLPLLETRMVLNRRAAEWQFLHADLLHPARRLWRRSVTNCALETLGREVLAIERPDDVPGWEIPERYFTFLRSRRLDPMPPVFSHNLSDLLTLAALSVRMTHVVVNTTDANPHHIAERFGLASLLEKQGAWAAAAVQYELILGQATSVVQLGEAYERLGLVYKRLRQSERARAAWEAILDATGGQSVLAAVELAKHYEHRERDYARALAFAEHARDVLNRWPNAHPRQRDDLLRRISRLRRKLLLA